MNREQLLVSAIIGLSISLCLTLALFLLEEKARAHSGEPQQTLSVERLRIVDSQGRTRIDLSPGAIEILDPAGHVVWKAPPFDWSAASGAVVLEPYTALGGNHWVQTVFEEGRIIILEDGSYWEVEPLNQAETVLWAPTGPITVAESDSPLEDFRYTLTNTEEGQSVRARYRGSR